MTDLPNRVLAHATESIELIWTPMDLDDQRYKYATEQDLTTNWMEAVFYGDSNTYKLNYEVNINYECIPRNNTDAFALLPSPMGNPSSL